MFEKSDKGVIFLNMYNHIIHPADAAFKKEKVFPKNLIKTVEEHFQSIGFPISDPKFRNELDQLLKLYDESKRHQPKKLFRNYGE